MILLKKKNQINIIIEALRKRNMQIELVSLEEGFDPSKVITNPVPVDNKTSRFTEDGVFSEKIFGSMESNDEFSCSCGEIKGRFNLGVVCNKCNTEVTFSKSNIERKGWIDLGERQLINPFFYYQIKKIVKDIDKIIQFDPKINLNGRILENEKNKYFDIGLTNFIDKYEEILNFYFDNSKKQEELQNIAEFLVENYDYTFVSKIPVYSPLLRPATMIGKTLKMDEANTFYNQIIRNNELIKEKEGIEKIDLTINPLLFVMQTNLNSVFDKILNQLSGKTGFLRNSLLGNRVNFSVRTVISPMPKGYEMHQMIYPYLAAVEMYKYEIINILSKTEGYTKAHNTWYQATLKYSEKVYSVLEELLNNSDGGLPMLLNRNPTIEFGSILFCRVVKVKKDISDLTLNISNNILQYLAGDYDGDTLSTFSIKDKGFEKVFSKFDPRKLVISNDTGKLNHKVFFSKDYKMGLQTLLD